MALWTGLGQAATVAQLAGVDATGLISMILEAVRTVKRNKEECNRLAERVAMIGELLRELLDSDMLQDPAIRKPFQGLNDTLRKAYTLITSSRNSSTIYNFFLTRRIAQIPNHRQNSSSSRTQVGHGTGDDPAAAHGALSKRPQPPSPPLPPSPSSPLNRVSHLEPWEILSAPQTPMRLGAFARFPAQTWGDDGYCSGVEEKGQTRQGPYGQGYQKDLLEQWSASRPGRNY
ncbi:unnamed protein product [Urochloa decumbens]|uniref:MCAfunc domain-containing protein n=1 Tax=Urochloa decumbens TaxID=240449 RepID=A0ABC8WXM9_9POAL